MLKSKGVLFTVEAFIASILVLSTVLFLYSDSQRLADFEEIRTEESLDNCLLELKLSSELGEVNMTEEEAVRAEVNNCIPEFINHELVFCENSCSSPLEDERNVVSSRRFSVDRDGPKELILYGWSE